MSITSRDCQRIGQRPIAESDCEWIRAIEETAFANPLTLPQLLRLSQTRQVMCGVFCRREGAAASPAWARVGYAMAVRYPRRLHVLRMAVAPWMQGRGYGREMLRWLEGFARRWLEPRVAVEVLERDDDARRFFTACGFRATAAVYSRSAQLYYQFELRLDGAGARPFGVFRHDEGVPLFGTGPL